ncbi:alpha/beta hydrolase [Henriciella aquimarina]|uniref:alpha/beta hydrolase n=1 Tax=Henriciella aquimarina TaxID=545261 RepID=UPI000A05A752|nr:alpha/beta hydrolase-fold protein [Henriciella aquimarina]
MTPSFLKQMMLGISLAALTPAIAAPSNAQPAETQGYVVPETEVWDIEAAHGETYRIYISRPEGEAPEQGYPVLYVLDGNALFAGFAEARRIQSIYNYGFDKMIVVGIGYPNQELYDSRRVGDFTPPIEAPFLAEYHKDDPSGKRDLFFDFLMDELRPEIETRYSINPLRQSLYGHSLGGLFALHVLYTQPDAFNAIIAASPAIWWDRQMIIKEEQAFAARLEDEPELLGHVARLLLLVGEREEESAMTGDTILLGERLKDLSKYGLRSDYQVFEDETHISVPSRSVTVTMREAMQWP